MDTVASSDRSPLGVAGGRPLERLRGRLLRAAARWFPSLGPDDLEDVVQSAWLSAVRTESSVESLERYLFEAVHTQGLMELRRRRRRPFESLERLGEAGDGDDRPADGRSAVEANEPSLEEQVETNRLAGLVGEMLEELPSRQRQVVKLRWGWGLSRDEIAAALGVSVRRVKRDLRRAAVVLEAQSALVRDGGWCERKRSLVTAYALGWLGPTRAAMAQRHLESCPACRALVVEQRARAQELAALLPAPAGASTRSGSWADATALVDSVRERLGELVAGAKQQAVLASARATDVSPLAGARPGSVAVIAAGCLAASGGAYCAVEGLPGLTALRSAADRLQATQEHPVERPDARPARTTGPSPATATSLDLPAVTPVKSPAQPARSKAPQRQQPAAAPDPTQQEFFGQSPQPTQQTAVAQAAAASDGSSTETSSSGAARVPAPATERGEFGGP